MKKERSRGKWGIVRYGALFLFKKIKKKSPSTLGDREKYNY